MHPILLLWIWYVLKILSISVFYLEVSPLPRSLPVPGSSVSSRFSVGYFSAAGSNPWFSCLAVVGKAPFWLGLGRAGVLRGSPGRACSRGSHFRRSGQGAVVRLQTAPLTLAEEGFILGVPAFTRGTLPCLKTVSLPPSPLLQESILFYF